MNDGYLILSIDNMGNAAFAGGECDEEVARILRKAADNIELGLQNFRLCDYNGNTVGRCEYEPAEEEEEEEEEEEAEEEEEED